MKKIFILILISIAGANLQAQHVMEIQKYNGDVIHVKVADIEYIKYVTKTENQTHYSIDGVYKTTYNDMTLKIGHNNHVTGTYDYKGGKIDEYLEGKVLTGTWTQNNGKGKIMFIFKKDFTSFDGKWGYDNNQPISEWKGVKK